MPEIVLEKIEEPVMEETAPEETAAAQEIVAEETTPEPIFEDEHVPEPPVLERQETKVPEPAPKRRGRPPKAKAEAPPKPPKPAPKPKPVARKKPPPPPESDSSSSEDMDDTLRNVYNHVAKPDMETAILQFLVNRKHLLRAVCRLWSCGQKGLDGQISKVPE